MRPHDLSGGDKEAGWDLTAVGMLIYCGEAAKPLRWVLPRCRNHPWDIASHIPFPLIGHEKATLCRDRSTQTADHSEAH